MYLQRKLPAHFFTINHPERWFDNYAGPDGDERLVLTPSESRDKYARDRAYNDWLTKHGMPSRLCKFQVVRVLKFKWQLSNRKDWWERYQDCLFRVFVMPFNQYSKRTRDHIQWYILCPEDSMMTLRWELEEAGHNPPPRDWAAERHISGISSISRIRLIPTECCKHYKHETTAGILPQGL
jgi:hypothetical protein